MTHMSEAHMLSTPDSLLQVELLAVVSALRRDDSTAYCCQWRTIHAVSPAGGAWGPKGLIRPSSAVIACSWKMPQNVKDMMWRVDSNQAGKSGFNVRELIPIPLPNVYYKRTNQYMLLAIAACTKAWFYPSRRTAMPYAEPPPWVCNKPRIPFILKRPRKRTLLEQLSTRARHAPGEEKAKKRLLNLGPVVLCIPKFGAKLIAIGLTFQFYASLNCKPHFE